MVIALHVVQQVLLGRFKLGIERVELALLVDEVRHHRGRLLLRAWAWTVPILDGIEILLAEVPIRLCHGGLAEVTFAHLRGRLGPSS